MISPRSVTTDSSALVKYFCRRNSARTDAARVSVCARKMFRCRGSFSDTWRVNAYLCSRLISSWRFSSDRRDRMISSCTSMVFQLRDRADTCAAATNSCSA